MQAIEVKFIGPTNSHGMKVKARFGKGVINSTTIAYDHANSEIVNAYDAAMALVRKLKLFADMPNARYISAETNEGWVFIAVQS